LRTTSRCLHRTSSGSRAQVFLDRRIPQASGRVDRRCPREESRGSRRPAGSSDLDSRRRFWHANAATCQNSREFPQIASDFRHAGLPVTRQTSCKMATFRRWAPWIAPRRSPVRVRLAPLREPLQPRGSFRFGPRSGLRGFGYVGRETGPNGYRLRLPSHCPAVPTRLAMRDEHGCSGARLPTDTWCPHGRCRISFPRLYTCAVPLARRVLVLPGARSSLTGGSLSGSSTWPAQALS
jgi:hypothetical protein